ncbi:hypothetical protein B0A55_01445 [Friedmanniomyces simplex]|uniref:Survival Motor Neuron Gemin2-binding domain-containing protein n=1 Tax=Friedmanniomyces simplex TaxID=329884 RepID=A0A4U0XZ93_9PEZI|nr:hypothetical protein B0A55_01445 [Friedmanniomyces simplex]
MAKTSSHEEVWDDSALVKSWNEALEEYKKYHSLAAKGEKIDLLLDQAENGELDTNDITVPEVEAGNEAPHFSSTTTTNGTVEAPTVTVTAATLPTAQQDAPPTAATTAATPPLLLNQTVQDESLKNIMLSWYYAGYYTGLHEGQQQKAYASIPQGG